MSAAPRCTQKDCGGIIVTDEETREAERGADSFVGIRCFCLLCGRPWSVAPEISLSELIALWGVPLDEALRARWASVAFLWWQATHA